MSALPSFEQFRERLNTPFAAAGAERPFDMELVAVDGVRASGAAETFSLLFRAPAGVPPAQGSYHLEHESLPAMELFLVPVRRDAEGIYFEAVFNLLRGAAAGSAP